MRIREMAKSMGITVKRDKEGYRFRYNIGWMGRFRTITPIGWSQSMTKAQMLFVLKLLSKVFNR